MKCFILDIPIFKIFIVCIVLQMISLTTTKSFFVCHYVMFYPCYTIFWNVYCLYSLKIGIINNYWIVSCMQPCNVLSVIFYLLKCLLFAVLQLISLTTTESFLVWNHVMFYPWYTICWNVYCLYSLITGIINNYWIVSCM